MLKQLAILIYLSLSHCLWCEQEYKKTGKIPDYSPLYAKNSLIFLPYNPIILSIGPDSLEHVLIFLNLSKWSNNHQSSLNIPYMAHLDKTLESLYKNFSEKSTIFCFETDSTKFQILDQEAKNFNNAHIFPFELTINSGKILSNWCEENQLSKIDLLSLNAKGAELQILTETKDIIQTARVIFVSTHAPKGSFEKIKYFLWKCRFTLISHWEDPNLEGRALFVQTPYYKGIYERKLI